MIRSIAAAGKQPSRRSIIIGAGAAAGVLVTGQTRAEVLPYDLSDLPDTDYTGVVYGPSSSPPGQTPPTLASSQTFHCSTGAMFWIYVAHTHVFDSTSNAFIPADYSFNLMRSADQGTTWLPYLKTEHWNTTNTWPMMAGPLLGDTVPFKADQLQDQGEYHPVWSLAFEGLYRLDLTVKTGSVFYALCRRFKFTRGLPIAYYLEQGVSPDNPRLPWKIDPTTGRRPVSTLSQLATAFAAM